MHSVQLGEPEIGEKDPATQSTHVDAKVAAIADEAVPAPHCWQEEDLGLVANRPATQSMQAEASEVPNLPIPQSRQSSADEAPVEVECVPAGHWVQSADPLDKENLPTGQGVHVVAEFAPVA